MSALRLSWRREPSEKGLARVCQGERGRDLHVDGARVAMVRPYTEGLSRERRGYYWYGGNGVHGIPGKNTHATPTKTQQEACDEAEAYIRAALGLPAKKSKAVPS